MAFKHYLTWKYFRKQPFFIKTYVKNLKKSFFFYTLEGVGLKDRHVEILSEHLVNDFMYLNLRFLFFATAWRQNWGKTEHLLKINYEFSVNKIF